MTNVGPVIIRDNGLTSFVPPCFHWELISPDGQVVAEVSDLDVSTVLENTEEIVKSQLMVFGSLDTYSTASGVAGVRLHVVKVG